MWTAASNATHSRPASRVYTGPHPLPPDLTLATLQQSGCRLYRVRPSGLLVLTVQPEIRGGGAKTESVEWAKARLAGLCLHQGVELKTTTTFVESFVTKAIAKKLAVLLTSEPSETSWQALLDLAGETGVEVPLPANGHAKAEARIKKGLANRKLVLPPQVSVEDVAISPGFFKNQDNTDTTILTSLRPGASGILLTSHDRASEVLDTVGWGQADELGLLVLGHKCPNPDTCGGLVSFPAVARSTGDQLLLAACLHNIGSSAVKTSLTTDGKVELPNVAICSFEVFAKELDTTAWQKIAQSPVRSVLEVFAEAGAPHAFHSPWSRRFRLQGQPSQPSLADQVSFMAKVDEEDLPKVLALSGHNSVYCAPRTSDMKLSMAYSVVWLGPHRADCIKAAMQVQDQCGMVCARGRYGLRVAAASYDRVHAQLRPGVAIPNRVNIQGTYKVGPIPRSAGQKEVMAWTQQIGWKAKVLKMVGPQHWILGAETPPPPGTLGWNGATLLATALDAHSQPRTAVQSGRVPKPLGGHLAVDSAPTRHQSGGGEPADPWQNFDPWRGAKLPGKQDSKPVAEARSVTGPVETRFQHQDQRLAALEQGMSDLRAEHAKAREEDRQQQAAQHTALEGQVAGLARQFSEQLKASMQLVQDAQLRQQEQMQTAMDELKSLIVAQPAPARKARREESDL